MDLSAIGEHLPETEAGAAAAAMDHQSSSSASAGSFAPCSYNAAAFPPALDVYSNPPSCVVSPPPPPTPSAEGPKSPYGGGIDPELAALLDGDPGLMELKAKAKSFQFQNDNPEQPGVDGFGQPWSSLPGERSRHLNLHPQHQHQHQPSQRPNIVDELKFGSLAVMGHQRYAVTKSGIPSMESSSLEFCVLRLRGGKGDKSPCIKVWSTNSIKKISKIPRLHVQ